MRTESYYKQMPSGGFLYRLFDPELFPITFTLPEPWRMAITRLNTDRLLATGPIRVCARLFVGKYPLPSSYQPCTGTVNAFELFPFLYTIMKGTILDKNADLIHFYFEKRYFISTSLQIQVEPAIKNIAYKEVSASVGNIGKKNGKKNS